MNSIKIGGHYEHFKGHSYVVLGLAKHSETLEELVIYQNTKNKEIWVRPKEMFFDKKEIGGKIVDRFKLIE